MKFGGSPKCPRCGKAVYFNERCRALDADWHKTCFKCENCEKTLQLGKHLEHENKPYCQSCFQKLWGPKGYGFGTGAGTLSDTGIGKDGKEIDYRKKSNADANTSGVASASSTNSQSNSANSSKQVQSTTKSFVPMGGNGCPVCSKSVGFAEKVSAMNATWHKDCFACNECKKRLDTGSFCDGKDSKVYCKNCYAKLFGPKGYGYGGALPTTGKLAGES